VNNRGFKVASCDLKAVRGELLLNRKQLQRAKQAIDNIGASGDRHLFVSIYRASN